MLTNRYNLPAPLVRAIRNDPYDGGDGQISVTRLLQPPQITKLSKGREIVEDASDRIWALLGQAVHTILERANTGEAGVVVEKRIYREILGWRVSGKFDVWEEGILSDYKITSVYARGGKIEWENQLNLLNALCHWHGITIERLQVVAIFRDWRPKEAMKEGYPQSQVAVIPVALWPKERAEAYLEERVRLHQQDEVPPCTDEERWHQPDKWALMKKGGKRAVKLFDLKPEIILTKDQYWEHRPGSYPRCESYCPASKFCPQWSEYEAGRRNQDQSAERQDVADAAGLLATSSVEC